MPTLRDLPALRLRAPDISGATSRGAVAGLQANQLREENRLRDLFKTVSPTDPAARPQLLEGAAQAGPNSFAQIQQMIAGQDQATQAKTAAQALKTAKGAALVLSETDPAKKRALWDQFGVNNNAFRQGTNDLDTEARRLITGAQTLDQALKSLNVGQPAQKGVKLGPGQQLVDPVTGQPRGAAVPPKSDVLSREAFDQKKALKAAGKPETTINLTEAQGKAKTFASRMLAANDTITKLENVGAATLSGAATKLLPNFLLPADLQALDTTSRDFASAILRKESGAAITTDEVNETRKIYIPKAGDSQSTLLIKRANRLRAIENMQREGGPAAKSVGDIPGVVDPNAGVPDDLTALTGTEILQRLEDATPAQERAIEAELKRRGAL